MFCKIKSLVIYWLVLVCTVGMQRWVHSAIPYPRTTYLLPLRAVGSVRARRVPLLTKHHILLIAEQDLPVLCEYMLSASGSRRAWSSLALPTKHRVRLEPLLRRDAVPALFSRAPSSGKAAPAARLRAASRLRRPRGDRWCCEGRRCVWTARRAVCAMRGSAGRE